MVEWGLTMIERNNILEHAIRTLSRKLAPQAKVGMDDLHDTEQDLRDLWAELKEFPGALPTDIVDFTLS